jgi:DUF1680 family protein
LIWIAEPLLASYPSREETPLADHRQQENGAPPSSFGRRTLHNRLPRWSARAAIHLQGLERLRAMNILIDGTWSDQPSIKLRSLGR